MRRVLKWLGIVIVVLVVLAGAGLAFLFTAFPKVEPAPSLKVASSPESVARGAYLANHVTACVDCHSDKDDGRYSGPPLPGTLGQGGEGLTHAVGFPGELLAPNITPAGIGQWSDGEVLRAMTAGVSRDGRPLFALMPYHVYRELSQADAEALIAYLRTLPAIDHAVAAPQLDFPLNLIVRTMPAPATLRTDQPAPGTPEYGKYMATIAGCQACHTPEVKGKPVEGMEFAGGQDFGFVRSANISPDPLTGIGNWTKEAFIARFRGFAGGAPPVAKGDNNTVMPWTLFAGMTDEDLGAIYEYLRTVKPIQNRVEKWPAAPAAASS
jgi:mono/diheme cytochrome c family protein